MVLRCTGDEVRELITTAISADVIEANYLVTANLVVTEDLGNSNLSAARLKEIEKYLAAHFVALAEERGSLLEEEIDDVLERTADVYAPGYASTRYGQQALVLDSSGKLAGASASSSKLKALFRIV